jgi:hypothetical protein
MIAIAVVSGVIFSEPQVQLDQVVNHLTGNEKPL